MTPEPRSNMAAACVASEVAVSVIAENSISSHVAPLHHCFAGVRAASESQ